MADELNLLDEIEETTPPSLTYRRDGNRITGMIDGLPAMIQAVDKLLTTELWEYVIYGDDYGVELNRLIGKPFDFVESDLERTITSALEVDGRFLEIQDFTINKTSKDSLLASFTVVTTEGDFSIEREVDI